MEFLLIYCLYSVSQRLKSVETVGNENHLSRCVKLRCIKKLYFVKLKYTVPYRSFE